MQSTVRAEKGGFDASQCKSYHFIFFALSRRTGEPRVTFAEEAQKNKPEQNELCSGVEGTVKIDISLKVPLYFTFVIQSSNSFWASGK